MFDRKQLERILTVNGVSPTEPDEVIRELLISARYNNKEVDLALMVLRENTGTHEQTVDSSHKIFRGDSVLSPGDISKLLGIEVNVTNLRNKTPLAPPKITPVQFFICVLIGVGILFGILYINSNAV